MSHFLSPVFGPGFFDSTTVGIAVVVGTVVAVVAGTVGVFTVMRGQSFAGEALGDIGTTGGSGAFLVSAGPLGGFVAISVVAAGAMELIGIQRPRGRDLATGIVLGAALGLAALFLYLDATYHNTTGATVTILFGSIFAISGSTVPAVVVLSALVVALLTLLYRPLLLSSVSPELAAARGIPVRAVGALYLLALAISVALAALTIGTILSTALLVGPAATALRVTRRPATAILAAGLIGVGATWVGIVLAYDSFSWSSAGHAWPVSFFVVTLVFVLYLLSGVPELWRAHARRTPPVR
ncbi:MAG TPA: metal ABC transporter permease [Solirubrobacteraceae bacterium]|nr:metal ABC transporter permease [Solirubrobacteraceae bacterium]